MAAANPFAILLNAASLQSSRPEFVEVKRSSKSQELEEDNQDSERDDAQENSPRPTGKPRTRPLKSKILHEDTKADRTVFVGNLSSKTTKRKLKAFFAECGAVDSIRFRSVVSRRVPNSRRPDLKEASRFNAYVVFKDPAAVEAALLKNGSVLCDQTVRVDGVTQKKSPVSYPARMSVFIGNVPHEVKEDKIHKAFADCGEVEGVRLVRDRLTGLCKGYGFVQFKDTSAVLLATKGGGVKVEGRQLRVLPCKPEGAKGSPFDQDQQQQWRGKRAAGTGGETSSAKRPRPSGPGQNRTPPSSGGKKSFGSNEKKFNPKKSFGSSKKVHPKPKHAKRKQQQLLLLQQQQAEAASKQ